MPSTPYPATQGYPAGELGEGNPRHGERSSAVSVPTTLQRAVTLGLRGDLEGRVVEDDDDLLT
jgi:hypothetical protein